MRFYQLPGVLSRLPVICERHRTIHSTPVQTAGREQRCARDTWSVARGDIWIWKMSFYSSPGKAETEHRSKARLKKYVLFINGDAQYITNSFSKNVLKMAIP